MSEHVTTAQADHPTLPTPTSLPGIVRQLTSGGRGILAADESIATMSQRLEDAGVVASAAARRDYRQLLLTAPGLSRHVSGIILCDETFGQALSDGRPFPRAARELGILPGIKVDTGTEPWGTQGALVTRGLDGLGARLADYAARGAAFAKWRAVFDVRSISEEGARVNAAALAEYARACQDHGIVPVVEPEVLAAGDHDMVACARASATALDAVFEALDGAGVDLAGIVLKPSFVTPGLAGRQLSARTVATVTLDTLRRHVPTEVAGIAFLSGGHTTADACDFLAALNLHEDVPWDLTFSFGRALVSDALETWAGSPAHVTRAQHALLAHCVSAARATARSEAA